MSNNNIRTPVQQEIVKKLVENFGIDGTRVLFLNPDDHSDPWLNSKALLTIARQSGDFKQVATTYSEYIPLLKQIVWSSTVVDQHDRGYTRSGVATIGEKLPNQEIPDEHDLAGSRALRAALDDAGFDVTKAAPAVLNLNLPPNEHAVAQEAECRRADLARIHILATQKGLIVPSQDDPSRNDLAGYRDFLQHNFGINTTAGMGPADRARVINALTEYDPIAAAA